jgi:hypothetical protein
LRYTRCHTDSESILIPSINLFADDIQWLDLSDPEHPGRRRLLYLLIKLAAASEHLPSSMFLNGVDLGDVRDPWTTGGFADIFRGTFQGQRVVGKRLRLHNLDKQAVHKVTTDNLIVPPVR